jgi:hypothetical protein
VDLKNPAVTGAIVGVRSAQQAEGERRNQLALTQDEIAEIEDYFVPEAA